MINDLSNSLNGDLLKLFKLLISENREETFVVIDNESANEDADKLVQVFMTLKNQHLL